MRRTIEVVAAVIVDRGRVLLASRPADKPPAGLEFPGGKVEPGESANRALRRELAEELNLDVVPFDELYRVETGDAERRIVLHFIRTRTADGAEPVPMEHQSFGWYPLSEERPPELLAPDGPVWDFLRKIHEHQTIFRESGTL